MQQFWLLIWTFIALGTNKRNISKGIFEMRSDDCKENQIISEITLAGTEWIKISCIMLTKDERSMCSHRGEKCDRDGMTTDGYTALPSYSATPSRNSSANRYPLRNQFGLWHMAIKNNDTCMQRRIRELSPFFKILTVRILWKNRRFSLQAFSNRTQEFAI